MTKTLATTALVLFGSAALACDYPSPPKDMPDGATSSKDEMIAGVKKIGKYQEDMTAYLSCIEADEIVAVQQLGDDDEDAKKQRKEMFDKKYNAAVDEQTRAVEEFNMEIREFKARSD